MLAEFRESLRSKIATRYRKNLPFNGHEKSSFPALRADQYSDQDLERINDMIHWNSFSSDSFGRRIGQLANKSKRSNVELIPNSRHKIMNERWKLKGKNLIEIGCFEGVHTLGLLSYGANVLAIDSRIENVVKTLVRCYLYGFFPQIEQVDVENDFRSFLKNREYVHHVGVLYHLSDPINHLFQFRDSSVKGILLDTHVAKEEDCQIHSGEMRYFVDGIDYPYAYYPEAGEKVVFSGMKNHAKWISLRDLQEVMKLAGFPSQELLRVKDQRNGQRVTLIAER